MLLEDCFEYLTSRPPLFSSFPLSQVCCFALDSGSCSLCSLESLSAQSECFTIFSVLFFFFFAKWNTRKTLIACKNKISTKCRTQTKMTRGSLRLFFTEKCWIFAHYFQYMFSQYFSKEHRILFTIFSKISQNMFHNILRKKTQKLFTIFSEYFQRNPRIWERERQIWNGEGERWSQKEDKRQRDG